MNEWLQKEVNIDSDLGIQRAHRDQLPSVRYEGDGAEEGVGEEDRKVYFDHDCKDTKAAESLHAQ